MLDKNASKATLPVIKEESEYNEQGSSEWTEDVEEEVKQQEGDLKIVS